LDLIFFPIKEALLTVKQSLVLKLRLFEEKVFLGIKLIECNILFKIEFFSDQLLELKSLFFIYLPQNLLVIILNGLRLYNLCLNIAQLAVLHVEIVGPSALLLIVNANALSMGEK